MEKAKKAAKLLAVTEADRVVLHAIGLPCLDLHPELNPSHDALTARLPTPSSAPNPPIQLPMLPHSPNHQATHSPTPHYPPDAWASLFSNTFCSSPNPDPVSTQPCLPAFHTTPSPAPPAAVSAAAAAFARFAPPLLPQLPPPTRSNESGVALFCANKGVASNGLLRRAARCCCCCWSFLPLPPPEPSPPPVPGAIPLPAFPSPNGVGCTGRLPAPTPDPAPPLAGVAGVAPTPTPPFLLFPPPLPPPPPPLAPAWLPPP